MNWGASVAGLVVGTLVGMTGVGGGALMAPALILLLGVDPLRAVGSDLAYASVTKAVGAWQHARRDGIDYRVVGWLALGSVPAALLAVALASHLPAALPPRKLVTSVLGGVLLISAAAMLLRRKHLGEATPLPNPWLLASIGVIVGTLVALTSVGSGSLAIAALTTMTPLQARRAVGTDVLHAMLLSLAAALAHWSIGTVDLGLTGAILVGSIPGVMLGSRLPARAPERLLRFVLAATLVLAGWQLVRLGRAPAAARDSTPAPTHVATPAVGLVPPAFAPGSAPTRLRRPVNGSGVPRGSRPVGAPDRTRA